MRSRLIRADDEGVNRLRSICAELIDPKIAEHRGRIVKTPRDGLLAELTSIVDALRWASEIRSEMVSARGHATIRDVPTASAPCHTL